MTYPVKPLGDVRPCLDARDLNKGIIFENHKPQAVEEIAHELAGALVFRCPEGLPAGTSHRSKQQTTGDQHTQEQVPFQVNAIWS